MACELCAAVKWNLCQLRVSEQGIVDSCQRQHTLVEAVNHEPSNRNTPISHLPSALRHKGFHPPANTSRAPYYLGVCKGRFDQASKMEFNFDFKPLLLCSSERGHFA